MASYGEVYEVYGEVNHTWTRRRLKAECFSRGLQSYSRLNKDQLIFLLNDNARARQAMVLSAANVVNRNTARSSSGTTANSNSRAAGSNNRAADSNEAGHRADDSWTLNERRPDDSWTVRELKAECRRRGLRRFARLTKERLVDLLNRGPGASSAPPPAPSHGGDANTGWRQRVLELKERADDALSSNRLTVALELSSQAISLAEQQALTGLPNPRDNRIKALLFANRATGRSTLGMTVEALRDCEEALLLKPDLWKTLLLKARLYARMFSWELAIQAFQSYLNTGDISDESRREATAELEQCRRTQIRSFDQQLGAMETLMRRMQAEARRVSGGAGGTPELDTRGTIAAEARAMNRAAEAAGSGDVHHDSGWIPRVGGVDGGANERRSVDGPSATEAGVSRGGGGSGTPAAAAHRVGGTCVVCMDREVNCTFVPCGHFCCCNVCAARVGQCPVCRATVERSIRTFMP